MRLHPFLFLFAIFAIALTGCQRPATPDLRLQAPRELVAAARDLGLKNLFANPAAQAPLEKLDAPKITLDPADAAASRDPSVWRRLDRTHRYGGVLLAGPTAEFSALLSHLAGSPDFRIARVDNWGVLLARGGGPAFVPPDPKTLEESLPDSALRATYLAQMAAMLDAAGVVAAAREFAAAAIGAAPSAADGYVATATIALRHRRYSDAVENAEKALKIDPKNLTALEVEVQTLVALNATDAAWRVARRLRDVASADDLNALFLHARVANAAQAYSDEQASLEALVAAAEKRGVPSTDYRIYLGQCYARQGLARPALEQFEILSKAKNLTDQQRADIATALQSIRSRAGALSN